MLISLDEIRTHLRLDDFSEDFEDSSSDSVESSADVELSRMLDAAIDYICNFTGRELFELLDFSASEIGVLKPTFKQAALLLIGEFYENREATAAFAKPNHNINTTLERILHFHRKGLGV